VTGVLLLLQATHYLKVKVGGNEVETESHRWWEVAGNGLGEELEGPAAGRQVTKAACEAAGGSVRLRRRAKRYGEGLRQCGSAMMPLFTTTERGG
jgi:hypothetical protein